METWQIRERGTNEPRHYGADFIGLVALMTEGMAPHSENYLCRKGEILVSESEYEALKAELAELKAQKGYNRNSDEALDKDLSVYGEPEKEVTRGDEIAKVIEEMIDHAIAADRANHIDVACDCWDNFAEHKARLATLINQGV